MKRKIEPLIFNTDIYYTIRRNIKRYRKDSGLSAAELAEMIGRSHDFVRQIESERVGYNFSVETFYRIAVALDVGMDVLAGKTIENKK